MPSHVQQIWLSFIFECFFCTKKKCFLFNFSDFAHFTDSSRGELVTLDRKSGTVEWKVDIGSPVVALFRLEGDGIVHTPFTSVSKETLNNLITHFDATEHQKPKPDTKGETKLL